MASYRKLFRALPVSTARSTWWVVAALLGWAELVTWRASRDWLPSDATNPRQIVDREYVLVLGNPMPFVQRWRVRIAVRSTDPHRARFIFSGGAVRTTISEAQLMADYATDVLGVPAANVIIEDQSRTTVENIVNSLPLMAEGRAIKIASDTFHARRARRILHDRSPSLAQRLVRVRDYVPLEYGPVHLIALGFEHYRQRRA